jgi:5'-nucleotidase
MRILIANDDGIYSPGLRALADAATTFGEVRIVAPDVEQSSMGHAITASRPLTYRQTRIGDLEAFRVNGTPADCVALGAHLWDEVDVVLSGINLGLNIGNSMWHSGTLAAAKQATLLGIRGIALSAPVDRDDEVDFEALKPWVERVLEQLLPTEAGRLLNVNFPLGTPRGITATHQSVRHYDGRVVPGEDPRGRRHFWFTIAPIEAVEVGTDRWAVENGYISVTPLQLDLTDHADLERLKAEYGEG